MPGLGQMEARHAKKDGQRGTRTHNLGLVNLSLLGGPHATIAPADP